YSRLIRLKRRGPILHPPSRAEGGRSAGEGVRRARSRLGMDLNSEPCRRTPHRWVQALVDMTDGYNGDPKIEVVFKRECVNCAQDIPTVQIVEGPIEFTSLCEHHVLRLSAKHISDASVTRRSSASRSSCALCANMRVASQWRNG